MIRFSFFFSGLFSSLILLAGLPSGAAACGDEFEPPNGLDELRLDAITGAPSPRTAREILAQGLEHYKTGQFALAEDAFRAARLKARRNNQPATEASALTNLGNLMTRRGKLLAAERLFQAALKLTRPHHLSQLAANTYYNIGILYKERGELERARRMYQRALSILNTRKGPKLHMAILNNLGNIYREQGKFRRAERVLKYSLKLAETHKDEAAAKQAAANLTRLFHDDYGINGATGIAYRRSISPAKRAARSDFKRAF